MEKENYFSRKMRLKSDDDLQEIVNNKVNFVDDARLAAIWELEKRNNSSDYSILEKDAIIEKIETKQQIDRELLKLPPIFRKTAYLIYSSLIIGLLKIVLYQQMTTINIYSDGNNLTIGLLTVGILGFLAYMISIGQNWARIAFTVLFAIGILGFPFAVTLEFKISPIIGSLSILQALIQLFAIILLFSKPVNEWYKK